MFMDHILPISVTQCKPHSVRLSTYRYRMGIKKTAAENAIALIKRRAGGNLKPNETSGVSRLKRLGLSHGVAQRLVMDEENVYISTLDVLAEGLGVQPWQLLVPGLDPTALPVLHPQVAAFSPELVERLRGLDDEQLRRVENSVRGLLDMQPLPPRAEGFPSTTGAETPAQKSTYGLPDPVGTPEPNRPSQADRRTNQRRTA